MLLRVLASTCRPVGVACALSADFCAVDAFFIAGCKHQVFVGSTARIYFVRIGLTRQLRTAGAR